MEPLNDGVFISRRYAQLRLASFMVRQTEIAMATTHWKLSLGILLALTGCNSSTTVSTDGIDVKEAQVGQNGPDRIIRATSQQQVAHYLKEPGLCNTEEAVLFQCQSSGKTMSVCGKKFPDAKNMVRFSLKETGSPKTDSAKGSNYFWSDQSYSGGGELQIHMDNADREFIAYSRVVRTGFGADGLHDSQDEAGIMERRQGRVVSHQKCDNPGDAVRYKADPAEYMPRGDWVPLDPP